MKISETEHLPSMWPVYQKLLVSPRLVFAMLFLSPIHTIAPYLYNWYLAEFVACKRIACTISTTNSLFDLTLPASKSILIFLMALALFSRAVFWAVFEIKAADKMQDFFQKAIKTLSHVRATWFDENPSGKLINRLFGDFGTLQRRFVFALSDGQVCYGELIAATLVVAAISPWAALPIIALWALIFWAQSQVNPAFAHLSGLSSKRKGRVIEVLSDVIEGASVYRSYQAEGHILERLRHQIQEWVSIEIFQWRFMTWSWTWMWLMAEAAIAIVVVSAALALHQGYIGSAIAGMILIAAGQQQSIIGWTLENIGGFLTSRAKAQRFLELCSLPDEREHEHRLKSPPRDLAHRPFPAGGLIEFKALTGSYRFDSTLVLNNLNLAIPQGCKLALVGRTGSGKSTMIQALFRMIHVHSGDITIDGCSIYDHPPEITRAIFGAVPQNPWLFAGTLRDNLDLKREFSTETIRALLDDLELQHFQLDAVVEEGGRNFSVGERQMICLTRCLLSNKRIIVMDEPTSNIDPETDARIQRMIRTKLADRTLIVIAHRQETIADFDRIFSIDQRVGS